jgi:glycosyltransferase involved in cell wall biosynthesis
MVRLKVLISAYSCRPGMGSEPGVGWNTARELAKHHNIWVLTRSDNRPMIEAELAKNPTDGFNFIYFDLSGVYWWKRGLLGVHVHYYLWQIKAYFIARQLHREIELDMIHHVTYVKYSSPSFLALLPVPFVWGPVGGGESTPKAFWKNFHLRGKIYETMRDWSRFLGERDPFVRMTARRSCIAYATTEDTARRLEMIGCKNVKVLSQVGLSPQEVELLIRHPPSNQEIIRFISIGRFLHWKGFHLGLQAFAQASLPPDAQYWIVGKGVEETELHSLVTDLGIASQVQFFQEMPRTQLLYQLGTCLADSP